MKRSLFLILLTSLLITPLSARSVGYGVGFYGQVVASDASLTTTGSEFSLVFQPAQFSVFNPSLLVKLPLGLDEVGSVLLPYGEIGLGIDLFKLLDHPFNFWSQNIIAYTPMVSLSYQYDFRRNLSLASIGFSPFKLSQKDFWYEFFSPFVTYDLSTGSLDNWGVNLIRYTYLFK